MNPDFCTPLYANVSASAMTAFPKVLERLQSLAEEVDHALLRAAPVGLTRLEMLHASPMLRALGPMGSPIMDDLVDAGRVLRCFDAADGPGRKPFRFVRPQESQ